MGDERRDQPPSIAYNSVDYAEANRLDRHHLHRVGEAFPSLDGLAVLEVGCGRGHLLRAMQAAGAAAIGVDVNTRAIERGVTDGIAVADATHLPFADHAFDGLVSVHTIEHLPDLDRALAEMVRVVRPGGRLLLIYPAEPIQGVWAIPTAVILHRNPLKARQVHCHKLTPHRLARRLAGLHVAPRLSRFRWRGWPQFTTILDRTG